MIPEGLPTTWSSTAFGPARWARAIPVLVDYLRPRYPTLTFLGGLGDQTHVTEGNTSAHNPITRGPDGLGLVLAIDLGVSDGNLAPLIEIRNLIYAHPNDPRMAGEGYMSGPDDKANNWPLGTGWNGGNTDIGHLHVNVAAKYFPFQPGGYLPSMDLTTPWDFMASEDDVLDSTDPIVIEIRTQLAEVRRMLAEVVTGNVSAAAAAVGEKSIHDQLSDVAENSAEDRRMLAELVTGNVSAAAAAVGEKNIATQVKGSS